MGIILFLLLVALLVGGIWLVARVAIGARERSVAARWPDPEVARRVLAREFWLGQSEAMLRDSLGRPAAVTRDPGSGEAVWKYGARRGARYELEIRVVDGEVVDWTRTTRWEADRIGGPGTS